MPDADAAFSREDLVTAAHLAVLDQTLTGFESTEEAVDTALEYVVEWLSERGQTDLSNTLNHLAFNR